MIWHRPIMSDYTTKKRPEKKEWWRNGWWWRIEVEVNQYPAMALKLRPKVSSIGSYFLHLTCSATRFSFSHSNSQACSLSKLAFHPLRFQRNKNSSPTSLIVRAARTESKGVTLGFRAPQFQVFYSPFFCLWFSFKHEIIFLFLFFNGLKLN